MMGRLMKFSVAGALGFVIQIAVVALLTSLGAHYLVATAAAVELAIVTNFVWHRRVTWADRQMGNAIRPFVRYHALTAATSLAASLVITAALVETMHVPVVAANIISVAGLGLVNFVSADALVFRVVVLVAALSFAASAHAGDDATLQAKTASDFARYSAAVEARWAGSLDDHEPFLDYDRRPATDQARILQLLRRGEVYIERAAPPLDANSKKLPIDGGMVNHWRGTIFVPRVTLDQLLKVLQEPQTNRHKQEDVLSSRVVYQGDDKQKLYLRLRRTKIVTVVYDSEYDVEFRRLTPTRSVSTSMSTRIVEVENAGTARERSLPEGQDHGFMWRLNSFWRYQQVDGGVMVEVESLTLSRDLPPIIGPLISPIVDSTARESIARTLQSLRARFSE